MKAARSIGWVALVGAVVLAPVLAGSPRAGVVDSPLPVLDPGSSTKHVFTVPGVIKNNNLETVFICTSLERTKTITFGVEVFPDAGGSPLNNVSSGFGDGAETLPPGGTVTIGTTNTAGIHEDEIITALGPASLRNGSARIVATSSRIACTVWVVDEISDPPVSMVALKVIGKRKQRGE